MFIVSLFVICSWYIGRQDTLTFARMELERCSFLRTVVLAVGFASGWSGLFGLRTIRKQWQIRGAHHKREGAHAHDALTSSIDAQSTTLTSLT